MATDIDFSQRVKEVLNRNNIQIRSLAYIDTKTKEELFRHRKKVILLIRNKVFEREINSLDNKTLDVFDTQLIPYLKKKQLILVVLPAGDKKRYVLQTYIDNIFIDRFRLIALDPRNNQRFPAPQPIVVRIRPVCDATAIRIQTGEIRPVRQNNGILADTPIDISSQSDFTSTGKNDEEHVPLEIKEKGKLTQDASTIETTSTPSCRDHLASIKDILLKHEEDDHADDFIRLEGQAPIDGTLLDISCGGMCVVPDERFAETFSIDQILAIECTFNKETSAPDIKEQLNLFIFVIVRNTKKFHGAPQLNLQFLANLPKATQTYW